MAPLSSKPKGGRGELCVGASEGESSKREKPLPSKDLSPSSFPFRAEPVAVAPHCSLNASSQPPSPPLKSRSSPPTPCLSSRRPAARSTVVPSSSPSPSSPPLSTQVLGFQGIKHWV